MVRLAWTLLVEIYACIGLPGAPWRRMETLALGQLQAAPSTRRPIYSVSGAC